MERQSFKMHQWKAVRIMIHCLNSVTKASDCVGCKKKGRLKLQISLTNIKALDMQYVKSSVLIFKKVQAQYVTEPTFFHANL